MQERPNILVPLRILEGEAIPEGIPELLRNAHVILLGYHVVPDQTATDQARSQFEEQALRQLDKHRAMLEQAGATVNSRLVFTHRGQKTIDRMITEHDCLAVLLPNASEPLENVLVAVRGTTGLDRHIRLLLGLFASTETDITLSHVVEENESDEDAKVLLEGIKSQLVDAGMEKNAVDIQIVHDGDIQDAIVDTAESFDAVVMGESDPSVISFVFGMHAEQVANRFLGPVFVVQRENAQDETDSEDEGDGM
jgi:nucleotide-binding universal stress UspA family protein